MTVLRKARFCLAATVLTSLAAWPLAGAKPNEPVDVPSSQGNNALLSNDCYRIAVEADGMLTVQVTNMPAKRFAPEFTVLWSETDPQCLRQMTHPNYPVAPRSAVRWRAAGESIESVNGWLASPEMTAGMSLRGVVRADGQRGRVWEFRNAQGHVAVRITGEPAQDTTRPFVVGRRAVLRPERWRAGVDRVNWEYPAQGEFALASELVLPSGHGDPEWTFTLTPKHAAFFSVAYTGAPDELLADTLPVPQECDARGHKLFNFVMSEADLHLPRVHVATGSGNSALVADPRECRFRLPTINDSRFGFMLQSEDDRLKPLLFAPLLGGPESRMTAGQPWAFTFRVVVRAGDWKATYAHIARDIHGLRDQRDSSGPGSLNGALERVMDFLADRKGRNYAMWDEQQKYYDYFTDRTGVFKPFSPLYGLGAAIVTDDEDFYRRRARPQVEFALSRRTSVFAPYETADNKQANSARREVGAPYLSYAQLVSLDRLFQGRTPGLRAMAEAKGPAKGKLSDMLAKWRLTHEADSLAEARALAARMASKDASFGEEDFFDLLELADATHEPEDIPRALEAAYHVAARLNLYPVPPDTTVTVDRGGLAPVHLHSFGRHHNIWGFPRPQPLPVPEQTVPTWRIARLGVPGPAYPMEYWMNTHGALMRTAALGRDEFLRNVARWGMVGRFGNYPGDNRSQDSLVAELPDAVEHRPWDWNFATVNPGHAWDFAGAVLDFIVSDAFERSRGAIDFPAVSAAGSGFRVRIYGSEPGRFYDDQNVRLWLPRGLVRADTRQLDWLAGYGHGNLYLALWNQSFQPVTATVELNDRLAQFDVGQAARAWRDNQPAAPLRLNGNRLAVTVAPKGIVALAAPAAVQLGLQSKWYDAATPPLGPSSFTNVAAPFGQVHAMLLRPGRGLVSAFVYAEALPENVIAARLWWRQGGGDWQEAKDEIYPYEFSPELTEEGGDFACVLEIQDARQQVIRSPAIILGMGSSTPQAIPAPPSPVQTPAQARDSSAAGGNSAAELSENFIAYLKKAANGSRFGLRPDGRFYPYSTPVGRRIAWRQRVWNQALFAEGCTPEAADVHLREALQHSVSEVQARLQREQPPVDFARLDRRQQETLVDLAHTEGVKGLTSELVAAVLARDWERLANDHLYIRYAGHAPDHPRNKAFAQRWGIP